MTTRKADLGELETLVMLGVLRLGQDASARRIREEVATHGGRQLSRGATYATLSRLERKGFLSRADKASPAPDRGRAKQHFQLTREGLATLRTAHRHLAQMRHGLESILDASS